MIRDGKIHNLKMGALVWAGKDNLLKHIQCSSEISAHRNTEPSKQTNDAPLLSRSQ